MVETSFNSSKLLPQITQEEKKRFIHLPERRNGLVVMLRTAYQRREDGFTESESRKRLFDLHRRPSKNNWTEWLDLLVVDGVLEKIRKKRCIGYKFII